MSYTRNSSADLVWNSTSNSYVPYSSSRNYVHQIKTVSLQNDCYANINYLNTVNLHDIVFVNNSAVNAFYNCQNLHSVYNISNTVTDISHAFASDNNLLVTPTVPDSVVNMYRAFHDCSNIVTPPVIPNSVTDITQCFEGASRISAIPSIPDSVVQCVAAFKNCVNATNTYGNYINNANSVDFTFYNTGLDTINMSFPKAHSCGYTFGYCNNLRIATIDAPNCTNAINMFVNCPNLATVSINAPNLANVCDMFSGCTNLAGQLYFNSVNITNAVNCFYNTSLKKDVIIKFLDDNDQPTATYTAFNTAYPVNTVNGIIHNGVTNNNGIVSNFSEDNYIWVEQTVSTPITSIEEVIKIHINSITPSNPNYNKQGIVAGEPYVGIATIFVYQDGRLQIYISSNPNEPAGSGNDIANGVLSTLTVNANSDYWIKFTWDGAVYKLSVSTDGTSYTDYITINNSLPPAFNGKLGYGTDTGASYKYPFLGSIDLRNSYVRINGQTWWRGYVRPNGVNLKDIDGSMISINPTPSDSTVLMFSDAKGATVNLDQFNYTYSNGDVEIQSLNTQDTAIVVPNIWTETNNMRAIDGSKVYYKIFKEGYNTVESEITVDGSQTINVNLEQIMCTYTVVPIPTDATVVISLAPVMVQGITYYAWSNNDSTVYTRYTDGTGGSLFESDLTPHSVEPWGVTGYYYVSSSGSSLPVTDGNGTNYITDGEESYWTRNSSQDIEGEIDDTLVLRALKRENKSGILYYKSREIDGQTQRWYDSTGKLYKYGDTIEGSTDLFCQEIGWNGGYCIIETKANASAQGISEDFYPYHEADINIVNGNSITVPWGTEVSYTVSKAHYQTVTGTEIVKTTGSKFVPLAIDQHTFTINATPNDATVQILVNGKLANASSTDWTFTADNLNGDIELQAYTGSDTVVTMPTQYNCENTVTADYGSTIEYKVSKDGYVDSTCTQTLTQDTTINVELLDKSYVVDDTEYQITQSGTTITLEKYIGTNPEAITPKSRT